MKKKSLWVGVSIIIGLVALSGCSKEQDGYNYLSTKTVTLAISGDPSMMASSYSGSKENVEYAWDKPATKLTIRCSKGYGYVTNSWDKAVATPASTITPTNSLGDTYDSVITSLVGGSATIQTGQQYYFGDIDGMGFNNGVTFTCVPLATDAQWAGN